ncbi:prohormone-3-like protein [Leptotrombidium deliense]|uniref:Prohormone-3-like protein n=1 Tax=Leptotrombidium deliense TaxID=299467 RepID=A0A443S8F7_9ACAR|nr:prohormone-3-like protein [Leptotrombidium deliense]
MNMRKKQYNDECLTSNECDSSRGLCCQLIRRHRMAPRKLCYYFVDPKSCLGNVDTSHVKPFVHGIQNAFFKARIG